MDYYKKNFHQLNTEEIKLWKSLTSKDSAFSSCFYQYSFAKAVSDTGKLVQVIFITDDNSIQALLAIQYESSIQKYLGHATRIGSHMSDYSGFICSPTFTPPISYQNSGLEYLFIDHVPFYNMNTFSKHDAIKQGISTIISLQENSEGYFSWMKNQSKIYYNDIKRLQRLTVKELGELSFQFHTTNKSDLDKIIMIKKQQYCDTNVKDVFEKEWSLNLLYNLLKLENCEVSPVLSTLYAGDTWLASHFGLISNGELHYWFPVYNPITNKYSPGEQLLFNIIESAHDEKIKHIDLGLGVSQLKDKFSNFNTSLYKGKIMNSTIKGHLVNISESLKWHISEFKIENIGK